MKDIISNSGQGYSKVWVGPKRPLKSKCAIQMAIEGRVEKVDGTFPLFSFNLGLKSVFIFSSSKTSLYLAFYAISSDWLNHSILKVKGTYKGTYKGTSDHMITTSFN